MLVYKVVAVNGGVLYSIVCHQRQLVYEIGKRTDPIVGAIFAFETLKQAKNFQRDLHDTKILICDAEQYKKKIGIKLWPGGVYSSYIDLFWSEEKSDDKDRIMTLFTDDMIEGTVLCSYVIPKEEVQW